MVTAFCKHSVEKIVEAFGTLVISRQGGFPYKLFRCTGRSINIEDSFQQNGLKRAIDWKNSYTMTESPAETWMGSYFGFQTR